MQYDRPIRILESYDEPYNLDQLESVKPDCSIEWKERGSLALVERLIAARSIQVLELRPHFEPILEHWQPLIDAIRNNSFHVQHLILQFDGLADRVHSELVAAPTSNTTIPKLTLQQTLFGWTAAPLTLAALHAMLPRRAAPLALHLALSGTRAYDGIDAATQKPAAVSDWRCIQQTLLRLFNVPEAWQDIRGVHLRCLFIEHRSASAAITIGSFLGQNDIECFLDGSEYATAVEAEATARAFVTACAGKPRTTLTTIFCAPFVPGLWCDDTDTVPLLLPSITTSQLPLTDTQIRLLANRPDLWPNVHTMTVMPLSASPVAALLRNRRTLTSLDIALSGPLLEAEAKGIAAALATSSVTRLTARSPVSKSKLCDALWLLMFTELLRHPSCGIEYLRLPYFSRFRGTDAFIRSLVVNRSLRVIDASGDLLPSIHNIIFEKPRLLAVPTASIGGWGAAPDEYEALMDFRPRKCHEDFEKYRKIRQTLRDRQIRYVLHRDVWQRATFTIAWFRANSKHELRHSCFALLPFIRELTGGARTSGFELTEHERLKEQILLPDMWELKNEKEPAGLFIQKRLNVQRLVDTRYARSFL